MGTAILRSQDCLRDRFHHPALGLTPIRNPNNACSSRSRRRKRSPVGSQANRQQVSEGRSVVLKVPAQSLVMGQVKILKRGEACDFGAVVSGEGNRKAERGRGNPKAKADLQDREVDLVLGSTDRLGPEPEMVQRQIKVSDFGVVDGIYAGSAIFTSPPPSSLPVPGFLGKHGAATSDLRRILRLI